MKKEDLTKEKGEKLTKFQKSIYNAKNILDTIKFFVLIGAVFAIVILIVFPIVKGDFEGLKFGSQIYADLISNIYVRYIILMPLTMASITCLLLSLNQAEKLLDSILKVSIFSEETIKYLEKCLNYLIIFWITLFIITFNLNVSVIVIIAIVNLCKHIFIYGHNLEKEIDKVI